MNITGYLISISIGVIGCILVYPSSIKFIILGFVLILSVIFGFFTALWINIVLSSPHKTTVGAENTLKQLESFRNKLMKDYDSSTSTKNSIQYPPIFGRTVDSLLQQLLDFILRDYVTIYLQEYAFDHENLESSIKEDMWSAIQILHERCKRVDQVKLIADDIVTKITEHFEKIREGKSQVLETAESSPTFILFEHALYPEKELEYLRNFSELLIMFLLPRTYSLSPTKYFLREVMTCKVMKPFIDNITDPDFFNRNVLYYIRKQQIASKCHNKSIDNANSLEDLLRIITNTNDLEDLKSLRYNIVTKLMQMTTLQNLNRAKGVDLDNDKTTLSSAGVQKSDINAAKKLRKFINQLTYAKKECEKKMTMLGWDMGYGISDDIKKVFPLSSIMEHVLGRKYLTQFLETLASQDLIRYWTAVEELRSTHRKNWHQSGAEIFYTFIRNPTSEIKVDKNTKKRMEAFLLGDKGPEVFYEVQCQVLQTIEDKYYQPFLISDYYKEMVLAIEKEDELSENEKRKSLEERPMLTECDGSIDNGLNVGDHSNYARRKLDQLQEKLVNKSQALSALRSSLRPESKVLSKLEKEVEWLQGEQRQLEAHLNRTEVWGENLGKWRANVQSADVPDEKEPPQFVLVVHMENESDDGEEAISTGWVVCRSLNQFQELHKKLRPLCAEVRGLELPSNSFKFLFGKIDKAALERGKQQIQKYLNFVLKDERLNQSEAIYSFLSPSSEHLKHSTPSPKKSRFSLSTLFKSTGEQKTFSTMKDSEDEDMSQISLDTTDSDTVDFVKINGNLNKIFDDGKDAIAEPLYGLLSELFDMRGFFKYIRKSLIGFVQVTYGRNINRQIYETISWYFSEQQLHYYITVILKNYWPGGALADPGPVRTNEEKVETAKIARHLFINSVPELLTTLVGNTAARNGANKLFEALQHEKMNRQLFYEIFEVVIDAIFPELN